MAKRTPTHRHDLTKLGDLAELQTFKVYLEELRNRRKAQQSGSDPSERNFQPSWMPARAALCPECQFAVSETHHGWLKTDRRMYDDELGMMVDELQPCPSCSGAVARRARFEQYRTLMQQARLPRASETWTFETFPMLAGKAEAVKETAMYARGAARATFTNLYLFGAFGGGKTGLAVCVARARLEQAQPVLFWTLPDLLTRIKATYDPKREESENELIEQLGTVDMLILDDLGTEKPSEWQREKLYQIINRRMNDDRETVFTSNVTPYDLEAHVGTRIVDRILYHCLPVELAGVNLRRQPVGGAAR